MKKVKLDNDVTDHIGLVYTKIETKLWAPIWLDEVYDENQIGQWPDQSYRYNLRRKRYWAVMINWIGCDLWWKPDKTTM